MSLINKDRVKETSTTTGTGTYTLAGAAAGFQAFSAIGDGNTTYYAVTDGTNWEVGIGTYTLSGTTLARTTIIASSNANAAVNWTAGTRTMVCTLPAEVFMALCFGLPQSFNGQIVESHAASAVTFAIKTRTGADPSAQDPVFMFFRDVTLATGDYTIVMIVAATSVTLSSGSVIGSSSGGTAATAFRVWLALINNAGTAELAVVNALSTTSIMSLNEDVRISTTAEGGAGAADSAQVWYSTTARTNVPFRVIGYAEWGTGITTAGTWAASPTKIQIAYAGIKLPGDVVQTVRTDTGAEAAGATTVPVDNTTPQNTEGDQYMSQAITPTAACNLLAIEAVGSFQNTVTSASTVTSLFQDSAANALRTTWFSQSTTGLAIHRIFHKMLAGIAAATTFKIRNGGVSGTVTFNGSASAGFLNGTLNSFMEVTEIMA